MRVRVLLSLAILAFLALPVLVVPAAGAVELTVMTGLGGERAALAREILAEYGAARGVTVELLDVPWVEILDKAATMAAGGTPPDVVRLDQPRVKSFAAAGLIADLTPWVERDGVNLERFPQGLIDMFRGPDFSLEALPSGGSVTVTFYNPGHFAEAGLAAPPSAWSTDGWLWDEFVEAAIRLTRRGGDQTDRFGLASFGSGYGQNQIGLWDLNWIDEGHRTFLGTSPAVLEAMERILALWTEHRVIPGPDNPGPPGDGFANQWASMAVAQDWLLQRYFQAQGLEFNVAPVPKGTARLSQVGVQAFSLVAQSPRQSEAWELVKYLTYNPEGARAWTAMTTEVPTLRDIGPDFVSRMSAVVPSLDAMVLVEAMLNPWNWRVALTSRFNEIYGAISAALGRVVTGEQALATALETIRPQIEAALAGN